MVQPTKDSACLIVFGSSASGALGAEKGGLLVKAPIPASLLPPHRTVRELACGKAHMLFLSTTGDLLSVGGNSHGQLGLGHLEDRRQPMQVSLSSSGIFQVAAGDNHSMVATQSGSVWVFGCNDMGQLGIEEQGSHPLPVMNPHIHDQARFVSCGANHSLVACELQSVVPGLSQGGTVVFGFGSNAWGQLGNGSHDNSSLSPVPCVLPKEAGPMRKIAAGRFHTLMLNSEGHVYACGRNVSGQLGLGKDMRFPAVDVPHRITALDTLCAQTARCSEDLIVDIACGALHSLLRTRRGRLLTFGNNHFGQLGQGITGADSEGVFSEPREVSCDSTRKNIQPCAAMACGSDHTLAVTIKGQVLAWGDNSSWQLGLEKRGHSALPSAVPVQQARGTKVRAGGDYSVCWTLHGSDPSDMVQAILQSELREARDQLERSQGAVAAMTAHIQSQQEQVLAASEEGKQGRKERKRVEQELNDLKATVKIAGTEVVSNVSEMKKSVIHASWDVEEAGRALLQAQQSLESLQGEVSYQEERALEKEQERGDQGSLFQEEREALEAKIQELEYKLEDAEERATQALSDLQEAEEALHPKKQRKGRPHSLELAEDVEYGESVEGSVEGHGSPHVFTPQAHPEIPTSPARVRRKLPGVLAEKVHASALESEEEEGEDAGDEDWSVENGRRRRGASAAPVEEEEEEGEDVEDDDGSVENLRERRRRKREARGSDQKATDVGRVEDGQTLPVMAVRRPRPRDEPPEEDGEDPIPAEEGQAAHPVHELRANTEDDGGEGALPGAEADLGVSDKREGAGEEPSMETGEAEGREGDLLEALPVAEKDEGGEDEEVEEDVLEDKKAEHSGKDAHESPGATREQAEGAGAAGTDEGAPESMVQVARIGETGTEGGAETVGGDDLRGDGGTHSAQPEEREPKGGGDAQEQGGAGPGRDPESQGFGEASHDDGQKRDDPGAASENATVGDDAEAKGSASGQEDAASPDEVSKPDEGSTQRAEEPEEHDAKHGQNAGLGEQATAGRHPAATKDKESGAKGQSTQALEAPGHVSEETPGGTDTSEAKAPETEGSVDVGEKGEHVGAAPKEPSPSKECGAPDASAAADIERAHGSQEEGGGAQGKAASVEVDGSQEKDSPAPAAGKESGDKAQGGESGEKKEKGADEKAGSAEVAGEHEEVEEDIPDESFLEESLEEGDDPFQL